MEIMVRIFHDEGKQRHLILFCKPYSNFIEKGKNLAEIELLLQGLLPRGFFQVDFWFLRSASSLPANLIIKVCKFKEPPPLWFPGFTHSFLHLKFFLNFNAYPRMQQKWFLICVAITNIQLCQHFEVLECAQDSAIMPGYQVKLSGLTYFF